MTKQIPNEQPEKDATQLMVERTEPIVKSILEQLLTNNLLLADLKYVKAEVIRQLEMAMKNIVIDHTNVMFKMIEDSLSIALEQAIKKYWGKDDNEISVADIESKLKSN